MFSHGARRSGGSVSMPDLSVMQSSPTSMWQFEMWTWRHESGLMPSVLGESAGLTIVTLSMVTFSQRTGLIVHAGDWVSVMPSTRTFRQLSKETRRGRGYGSVLARCAFHQRAPRPSIVP